LRECWRYRHLCLLLPALAVLSTGAFVYGTGKRRPAVQRAFRVRNGSLEYSWHLAGRDRASLLVVQTSGWGRYQALLNATMPANKAWALGRGHDFMALSGTAMGGPEWHSTYNKVHLMRELARGGEYGRVLYMDADAVVTSEGWDLGPPGCMLSAQWGPGKGPWDVNAGVMLWDLRSKYAADVIEKWHAQVERTIGREGDDQWWLQQLLKRELGGRNYTAARDMGMVVLETGGNLMHALRDNHLDWSGMDVPSRIARVREHMAAVAKKEGVATRNAEVAKEAELAERSAKSAPVRRL